MAKPKIGDIVEVKTAKGLAYAQYSHKHKQFGSLLRVFSGLHKTRPESFNDLVNEDPAFMCFFPLDFAVSRKIVTIVDHVSVPSKAQIFPTFRAGNVDPATRKVGVWWLWDGENEWPIGDLSAEQRKLSIRGVWNDTALIERIEAGWTPESDPT